MLELTSRVMAVSGMVEELAYNQQVFTTLENRSRRREYHWGRNLVETAFATAREASNGVDL